MFPSNKSKSQYLIFLNRMNPHHQHMINQNLHMNLNMGLQQANTSVNIQSLSPKQLLGECIDLATSMFKELIGHFLEFNHIENPFGQKVDFAALMNYILEPARLEQLLEQYVKSEEKAMKTLVKSWIFELKYLRNCWAHSEVITQRLAIRGFDTLSMTFQAFGGSPSSPVYQKIQLYRKNLTIAMARSYVTH